MNRFKTAMALTFALSFSFQGAATRPDCLAPKGLQLNYPELVREALEQTAREGSRREDRRKGAEWVNVLDLDGNYLAPDLRPAPAGSLPLQLPKKIAHRYGLVHQGANVLFVCRPATAGSPPRLLLQRRSATKRVFPNTLTFSASGHMDEETDPVRALLREVQEEIGLQIDPAKLISVGNSKRGNPNFMKIWKHQNGGVARTIYLYDEAGETLFVEGSAADSHGEKENLDRVLEYVRKTEFPGNDRPAGLELFSINREFNFTYVYPLSDEERGRIQFEDGEVSGIAEVSAEEFLALGKPSSLPPDDAIRTLLPLENELKEAIGKAQNSFFPSPFGDPSSPEVSGSI